MTIFGNRDFPHGKTQAASADTALAEQAAVVLPRAFAPDVRRVVLRVQGGEEIVVGRADERDSAVQIAREMVRHIEQAATRGEWPQVDERFIRPGAIVSVDVQRAE